MRRVMMVLLLASISLAGCARIIGGQDTEFYRADSFLKEKNYPEAITAYRQIAKKYADTTRAAEARFALASALAYYDNPQKDYELALQEFDEFLKLYPDSEKAHEARQWHSLLQQVLELEKENERLNKNVEHLNKNIEQLKQLDIRHEERRRK